MSVDRASLLVTTALEGTRGRDEEIVFLGEWCKLYDCRAAWTNRVHRMIPYHWDDRKKLRCDHDYLKKLHQSLLENLAQILNRYHSSERSLRYWRTILDPWLLLYVSVIFDRWECLRVAFEEYRQLKTIAIDPPLEPKPCFDCNDFYHATQSDLWNHQLFLEIIQSHYPDQCEISWLSPSTPSVAAPRTDSAVKPKQRSLKSKIARFLDNSISLLTARNKVVFYESHFSPASLVRLNLMLRQVPRFYLEEFEWPVPLNGFKSPDESRIDRSTMSLQTKAENTFEELLFKRIIKDIPSTYVEGFSALRAQTNQIHMRPKVILTANAHWHNELFKLWSAEQVFLGSKLIAIQHGGSINLGTMSTFNFEEDISDSYITWGPSCHAKHIPLPASKFCGLKYSSKSSRPFCSLIGIEMPRYPFRAQATPIAGQSLVDYYQALKFYKCLNPEVQDRFRVKPYPDFGWNTGQRFIDDLGEDKVYRGSDFNRFLAQSRVIVCTYPQTTFSDAMASGLPTILMYPAHLWETAPDMDPLVELLRAARIVFHDPQLAAAHVNDIWADPDPWWRSAETIQARKEFHRQALVPHGNWLKEWTDFLNSYSAKN